MAFRDLLYSSVNIPLNMENIDTTTITTKYLNCSNLPICDTVPSQNNQLVNKLYIDTKSTEIETTTKEYIDSCIVAPYIDSNVTFNAPFYSNSTPFYTTLTTPPTISEIGVTYGSTGVLIASDGHLQYSVSSSPFLFPNNQYTLKFKFTPNYIMPPNNTNINLFTIGRGDRTGHISLYEDYQGNMTIEFDGCTPISHYITFAQNQQYEIEVNIDLTALKVYVFIDGVKIIDNVIDSNYNNVPKTVFYLGNGSVDNGFIGAGSFAELVIFKNIQHTANYTPGYIYNEKDIDCLRVGRLISNDSRSGIATLSFLDTDDSVMITKSCQYNVEGNICTVFLNCTQFNYQDIGANGRPPKITGLPFPCISSFVNNGYSSSGINVGVSYLPQICLQWIGTDYLYLSLYSTYTQNGNSSKLPTVGNYLINPTTIIYPIA